MIGFIRLGNRNTIDIFTYQIFPGNMLLITGIGIDIEFTANLFCIDLFFTFILDCYKPYQCIHVCQFLRAQSETYFYRI